MAPYLGNSLYTWTTVIGVVLAGISIGNFLGGRVADRGVSTQMLARIFIAAGLSSAAVLVLVPLITALAPPMPLIPRIVLFFSAAFFLPSLIMGMITPVVVKLAIDNLENVGKTVGSIYAVSTVGSILGTFATGFVLISWLGTRTIVLMVAVIMLLMGVAIGGWWRQPRTATLAMAPAAVLLLLAQLGGEPFALWISSPDNSQQFMLATATVSLMLVLVLIGSVVWRRQLGTASALLVSLSLVSLLVGWRSGLYAAPCLEESDYFCIRTDETTVDGHEVRALVLDHLIHSYVSLDDPTVLGYGYEQVYKELTRDFATRNGPPDTLFIGGGGYTFPRYMEVVYPGTEIVVLEIDPAVTRAAHRYLEMPKDTTIRPINEDARQALLGWQGDKKFEIIYGDAFNDLSVPYHLTTVEFNRLVAERLEDNGVYLVNVIDKYVGGEFMKSFANSLAAVFPHVYLLAQGEAWRFEASNTYVLLASRQPFDYHSFLADPSGQKPGTRMQAEAEFAEYRNSGRALTLTDDYVPVDQLMAALFVERGG